MELLYRFQLKTRNLYHSPSIFCRSLDERDKWFTNVSSNLNIQARVAKQFSYQAGCRRLAVASGDGDNFPLQISCGELYLTDNLGPSAFRVPNRNDVRRYARAHNHQVKLIEKPTW